MSSIDKLTDKLRTTVSGYLDIYVSKPALETVTKNLDGQARIASLGAMLNIVLDKIRINGIEYDKEYLSNLSKEDIATRIESLGKFIEMQEVSISENKEIAETAVNYLSNDSSKKYLLEYLIREHNWITVSLISASYISSLVLMRSTFELAVGMATRKTGGMTDRIYSIRELSDSEKKQVKDQWYRLCAWSHPYGKWQKEVCPIYLSHNPLYHPKLFSLCLEELVQLVDFILVIAFTKYELNITELKNQLVEENIDYSRLELVSSRLEA